MRAIVVGWMFLLLALGLTPARSAIPRVSHVTVVVMENRSDTAIVSSPDAPYFNHVLAAQGVLLRDSHAVMHPSEPNYLALFSGSTQGLTDDSCPHLYAARNIASELIGAGKSFGGYAESMPREGFTGCWGSKGLYGRKHVPWVDFSNVPASDSHVYRGLPSPMPTLAWIVPNTCNDMHSCSTKTGDDWMRANLPAIVAWDAKHDGLLIVTWDEAEPDRDGTNRIPTLLVGPMLRAGVEDRRRVDHYAVLRTIESLLGLPCIAHDCHAAPIEGIR